MGKQEPLYQDHWRATHSMARGPSLEISGTGDQGEPQPCTDGSVMIQGKGKLTVRFKGSNERTRAAGAETQANLMLCV